MRSSLLLTNDDGIDSPFLQILAERLYTAFEVIVVAPARDQSGVGRSYSCNGRPTIEQRFDLPFEAWVVSGTPSDCVHLALTHLLNRKPDAVVSGVNIGGNFSVPIVLSSGTIGGAIEGSLWGIPAVALSMDLTPDDYNAVKANNPSAKVQRSLENSTQHAIAIIKQQLSVQHREGIVHNINFPLPTEADTPVERTRPSRLRMRPFFEKTEADGAFAFSFEYSDDLSHEEDTDMACCMRRRHISHSVIDLYRLSAIG